MKLPQFIRECLANHSQKGIREVLQNSSPEGEELMEHADFGHPADEGYGRSILYNGAGLEILLISWSLGDFTAIHDHGNTHLGFEKAYGELEKNIFRYKSPEIQLAKSEKVEANQLLRFNEKLIHQMGNPSDEKVLSLHVYASTETRTDVTGEARIFKFEKNRIITSSGDALLNLPESEIESGEKVAFEMNEETWQKYSGQLEGFLERFTS